LLRETVADLLDAKKSFCKPPKHFHAATLLSFAAHFAPL
jgi:hypothetical protein